MDPDHGRRGTGLNRAGAPQENRRFRGGERSWGDGDINDLRHSCTYDIYRDTVVIKRSSSIGKCGDK